MAPKHPKIHFLTAGGSQALPKAGAVSDLPSWSPSVQGQGRVPLPGQPHPSRAQSILLDGHTVPKRAGLLPSSGNLDPAASGVHPTALQGSVQEQGSLWGPWPGREGEQCSTRTSGAGKGVPSTL